MRHFRITWFVIFFGLAACSQAAPTGQATLLPPPAQTPTLRIRLVPSWTPTLPGPATTTPTPPPRATPLVTQAASLPATPRINPTPLDLFSLRWIDRTSFETEAQPLYLVEMRYDPALWNLESAATPAGLGYQLSHRFIPGCRLRPTSGTQAAEGDVTETEVLSLGDNQFQVSRTSRDGNLVFSDYCSGSGESSTCYQVVFSEISAACVEDSQAVLGTLAVIPNPNYSPSGDAWLCRDERNTPGLCQISYTTPLNALAFSPAGDAWAVGDDGLILQMQAEDWVSLDSPASTPLYDISLLSETNGWAAGAGGLILHWDGSAWSVSLPEQQTGVGLFSLAFTSPADGWAAGARLDGDGSLSTYLLHWNGTGWQEHSALPECTNCGLNAVLAISPGDVWAAGGEQQAALALHWDGARWENISPPGQSWLYALRADGSGRVWAAGMETGSGGDRRGVVFSWDGRDWQRFSLPPHSGGFYALAVLAYGRLVVSGDYTALFAERQWYPLGSEADRGEWIVDMAASPDGTLYALTRAGNLYQLEIQE